MTDEPFGRQPQPVRLDFTGDLRDVYAYMQRIKRIIENDSYDNVVLMGNQMMIYPRVVND